MAKGKKMAAKMAQKVDTILGVRISSTSPSLVLKFVESRLAKREKLFIVTPNPEIVIQAQTDPGLKHILNLADLALPDGVGLIWASRWRAFNVVINERVSGIDVMIALVGLAAKRGWRVFLLGGKPGVAQAAAHKLKIENARQRRGSPLAAKLKIEVESGPWLLDNGQPVNRVELIKERQVIEKINRFQPDLLFVGFGAPKQEKWVTRNYDKLQANCIMVVGGSFDYLVGRPRAPRWLQQLGLEWLFRLVVEPWRVKRQLALVRFAWLILRSK